MYIKDICDWLELNDVIYYDLIEHPKHGYMVNVRRSVYIIEASSRLRVKFNQINGDFHIEDLGLTSLVGSPNVVTGNYVCNYNNLDSLLGAPAIFQGNFECRGSNLKSLKGAPATVGKNFECSYNELEHLHYAPAQVGADFYAVHNRLKSLEGLPRRVVGAFFCDNNPALGELQQIQDFDVLTAQTEKIQLSQNIENKNKGKMYKL